MLKLLPALRRHKSETRKIPLLFTAASLDSFTPLELTGPWTSVQRFTSVQTGEACLSETHS